MERNRTPRRRPEVPSAPTTLTEIARRYVATAVALSRAMGLPWTEDFLRQHRESISCCFIEAGRAGVRLPPAVSLPPLTAPAVEAPAEAGEIMGSGRPPAPEAPTTTTGDAALPRQDHPIADPSTNGVVAENATAVANPTTIPTDSGLPCGGQLLVDLKPAPLSMLIGKVGRLAEAQGGRWAVLLRALQAERAGRLDRGRKTTGEG